jgi:uncharacterized coiled-coil DUF342 family protein
MNQDELAEFWANHETILANQREIQALLDEALRLHARMRDLNQRIAELQAELGAAGPEGGR